MKYSLLSLIFLKRLQVFPILLFSSISLHWSLRKAFLSLLAILWNSAFKCVYLSFSPLLFTSLLFTAICKASSDSHFAFLFLGDGLDPCLLYNVTNLHLQFIRHSIRAAAAAKSLQLYPTLQPHRWKPTRLPHPCNSPGKNTRVGCHLLFQCMKVKSESEVGQSCPTLSDPMDCSPSGSSVHGIFQARVLEWGAIAFSERSCMPQLISGTAK